MIHDIWRSEFKICVSSIDSNCSTSRNILLFSERSLQKLSCFFFFFFASVTGDILQTTQATEILTIFCLLYISSQHDGTTVAHFGFRHRYLTHRCHPRKTRHSTQTHTHSHMTSMSRSRLSELKPGSATWVVVTLYLITFSQAVFKCCSRSVNRSQNLSETYYRCTHQRSGPHACTPALL